MECGKRRRKWLMRYVGVCIAVLGMTAAPRLGWAGSVDPSTGEPDVSQEGDSETCLEAVQEWLEDGDTRFVDWGGHGKCRPDSARTKAPEPAEVTTRVVKELQSWLYELFERGHDRD